MELLLILLWAGVFWYIAKSPKETMQVTWIILVGAITISPVIAWIWPAFR